MEMATRVDLRIKATMKITKFGHCCLLVEENGVRILTDPGIYSTEQNNLKNIDLVLISHEHQDHFHIDSVKEILKNNPQTKIITNKSVGALLEKEDIAFIVVEDGKNVTERGILIEGFGNNHAIMHSTIAPIQNTGYFISNKLFYPGDTLLTNPGKPIEILALPTAGPWMKLPEAIDYALAIKPKICFPVHDGILKTLGSTNILPPKILEPNGIKFSVLEIGREYEF